MKEERKNIRARGQWKWRSEAMLALKKERGLELRTAHGLCTAEKTRKQILP